MNISDNKFISLTYSLKLNDEDGDQIETVGKEQPFAFIYGSGNLLPAFESNIKDLEIGDAFSFHLTSDEAYGSIREEAIVDVPLSAFEVNGEVDRDMIQVGKTIPMRDHHGNRMNGAITGIEGPCITMDFNHPLAGRSLYFEGKVLDVREPTDEELQSIQGSNCGSGCGCEKEGHASHENSCASPGNSSCGCGNGHC